MIPTAVNLRPVILQSIFSKRNKIPKFAFLLPDMIVRGREDAVSLFSKNLTCLTALLSRLSSAISTAKTSSCRPPVVFSGGLSLFLLFLLLLLGIFFFLLFVLLFLLFLRLFFLFFFFLRILFLLLFFFLRIFFLFLFLYFLLLFLFLL